jgi:hypothetical protein
LVLPCTEQGIRNAVLAGGGPYTFDCDGPTTVAVGAGFGMERDVILDGESNLTVDVNQNDNEVFILFEDVVAELRGITVTGSRGEGIDIRNGTLTLANSTVSGNGGEEETGGGISNSGTLTLTNSTVSGNMAAGGGIQNYGSGTLTLTNSTVSGNTGKSIDNTGTGTVTMTNSTVSGEVGFSNSGTLKHTLIVGGCSGDPVTSNGYNIESPGDTCGFDQEGDQPGVTAEQLALGPLANNGGPTMTHALGAGSVAIDQIPEADCVDADGQPLTTDQRGEPRPETGGTMCDVGAFEVQP